MIGNKLKELRKDKKLTQQQISDILNVKQNTYSQWENDINEPDLLSLVKIADILKVSTDYLLGRYKN